MGMKGAPVAPKRDVRLDAVPEQLLPLLSSLLEVLLRSQVSLSEDPMLASANPKAPARKLEGWFPPSFVEASCSGEHGVQGVVTDPSMVSTFAFGDCLKMKKEVSPDGASNH